MLQTDCNQTRHQIIEILQNSLRQNKRLPLGALVTKSLHNLIAVKNKVDRLQQKH